MRFGYHGDVVAAVADGEGKFVGLEVADCADHRGFLGGGGAADYYGGGG